MNCVKLPACPFFHENLPNMPGAADALKQRFCLGSSAGCARFQVSTAGKPVPPDLFPNHQHRVAKLTKP
jgi:hypothetical protein